MQTTHSDVFALKNSGLDAFLYANVGTELNGSALTILSMIARVGRDPWAEAARWATLPRAGAIESLAQSIGDMPLTPSALAESHAIAVRLVQLLPATTPGALQSGAAKLEAPSAPGRLPIVMLYAAMALGIALSALLTPKPTQAVVAPTDRPMAVPGASVPAPAPFVNDERVTGLTAAPSGPRAK